MLFTLDVHPRDDFLHSTSCLCLPQPWLWLSAFSVYTEVTLWQLPLSCEPCLSPVRPRSISWSVSFWPSLVESWYWFQVTLEINRYPKTNYQRIGQGNTVGEWIPQTSYKYSVPPSPWRPGAIPGPTVTDLLRGSYGDNHPYHLCRVFHFVAMIYICRLTFQPHDSVKWRGQVFFS